MYNTEIEVNGKTIKIRFGAYVIKCLADAGIGLDQLSDFMTANPADIIPKIIYFGALNASHERKGENISINDIYDWIDETEGGLFGQKIADVITLFTNQMTEGVPKNVKAVQKTPQPK